MKFCSCILCILGISWSAAQDLRTDLKPEESLLVNPGQLPELRKASALPKDAPIEVLVQDTATLNTKNFNHKSDGSIPEMASISEKSVYHTVAKTGSLPVSSVQPARLDNDLQKVSAAYRKSGQEETSCVQVAMSVRQLLKRDPGSVLQVVADEMHANSKCSCEVVKVAIAESDMQVSSVLAIVKVAIESSPENMRLIAQCAIAACPESLAAVQDLVAKYEKTGDVGESAKSAKSAKGERATMFSDEEVAAIANPLDSPAGPRGHQTTFQQPPLLIITPQNTTKVDP